MIIYIKVIYMIYNLIQIYSYLLLLVKIGQFKYGIIINQNLIFLMRNFFTQIPF